ncbi:MAG: IclR family transcriptional regulator [Bryobacteraceae bacterium]
MPKAPAKPKTKRLRKAKPYFSRAVSKALEALEILKRSPEPMALHQLAAATGLTKTSLLRILQTLEDAGYLERDNAGHYRLTADIRPLVPTRLLSTLLRAATPVMRGLTREFGETTGLAFLFDNHIEVIAVVESPHLMRMGNTVGRILQPHASALGKSITAFQADQRRERLLRSYGIAKFTPRTITDENKIAAEFARIRERGYSTDAEETTPDGCCFGAPIFTAPGPVLAAVSMSIPKSRLGNRQWQEQAAQAVRRAAKTIGDEVQLKNGTA